MSGKISVSNTTLSEKNLKILSVLLYLTFFFIVLFLHKNVFAYSDDTVFRDYLNEYSIIEQGIRTWQYMSGKALTDTFGAALTLLPLTVWSICDSFVWLLFLIMFGDIIYGIPAWRRLDGTLMLAFLLLMLPVYYLTSAGFILTSTNYVYTLLCDILVVWRIICSLRKDSLSGKNRFSPYFVFECILVALLSVYGAGQEQSAMILLGILCFIIVRQISDRSAFSSFLKGPAFALTIASFIGTLSGLAFVMLSPGHINRSKSVEGTFCVPGYAGWNWFDKIMAGYTTTVANFVYYQTWIFLFFTVVLAMLGFCCRKKLISFLSCVPAVYALISAFLLPDLFSFYPDYGFGMKDLLEYESPVMTALNLLIPFMVFLLICFLIWQVMEDKKSATDIIFILILGLGSRVMMGFSATLYGSSFRTFIYLLMAMVFCTGKLYQALSIANRKLSSIVLLIAAMIAARTVFLNSVILSYFKSNGVTYIRY